MIFPKTLIEPSDLEDKQMVQSDVKISVVIADTGSRESLRLCLQQLKTSLLGYNSDITIVTDSPKNRKATPKRKSPRIRRFFI